MLAISSSPVEPMTRPELPPYCDRQQARPAFIKPFRVRVFVPGPACCPAVIYCRVLAVRLPPWWQPPQRNSSARRQICQGSAVPPCRSNR